jgi:hypothetical protein
MPREQTLWLELNTMPREQTLWLELNTMPREQTLWLESNTMPREQTLWLELTLNSTRPTAHTPKRNHLKLVSMDNLRIKPVSIDTSIRKDIRQSY